MPVEKFSLWNIAFTKEDATLSLDGQSDTALGSLPLDSTKLPCARKGLGIQ